MKAFENILNLNCVMVH